MIFGCDLSIEEYAKDLEKLGYTHEESTKIAEWYAQTHQEFKLDEEGKRIISECNNIDSLFYICTRDKINEMIDICKKRYKENNCDECCRCFWFDNSTGERFCTVKPDE